MIWTLLIIFQLKHFIADYPLQTPYMLGKFKSEGWVKPLSAHCGVHFLFTGFIAFFFGLGIPAALALAALDFTIHFIMDRIKASPKLLGRFEALSKNEFQQIIRGRESAQIGHPYFESTQERDTQRIKNNTYFWYSLGLDQMVHHLTDILIIYLIMQMIGG